MIDIAKQIFGWLIAVGIIFFCLVLLWALVRFSVISKWRTRGWQKRLRQPQVEIVAAHWQVRLPAALDSFYRNSDAIELEEFCLTRSVSPPAAKWFVHGFIPLTVVDLLEWIKITGVPGLPIATGGEDGKSTYYLPFESLRHGFPTPVLIRSAGGLPDVEAAPTIEDFTQFQPIDDADEEDE